MQGALRLQGEVNYLELKGKAKKLKGEALLGPDLGYGTRKVTQGKEEKVREGMR